MRETRVFLHGDIDLAAAPEVRSHLFEAVESTDHDVAVDCCGVTFMDSTGVALDHGDAGEAARSGPCVADRERRCHD